MVANRPTLIAAAMSQATNTHSQLASSVERIDERLSHPTVSVDVAAELLGISRASAFRAVHRGQLPAIRLGRRIVIPTAELRQMLRLSYRT
jgi:excisionase family DNA binding protein